MNSTDFVMILIAFGIVIILYGVYLTVAVYKKSNFAVFWYPFMNDEYDREWDKKMLELLASDHKMVRGEDIETVRMYTVKWGDTHVWIRNWPYSSFTTYDNVVYRVKIRPSRLTMFKLAKRFERDLGFPIHSIHSNA